MLLFLSVLSVFLIGDMGTIPENMDFEMVTNPNSVPYNWTCEEFSGFEYMPDSAVFHTGLYSARLLSIFSTFAVYNDSVELEIGYLERVIPFNYTGNEITLSGYFKLEGYYEESYAGMYMVLMDADGNPVDYNQIIFEEFLPDSEWTSFSLNLTNSEFCDSLDFGSILGGPGTLWIDDMQLKVDGVPLENVPQREEFRALEDHEFDNGSGILLPSLSSFQLESLEQLGKVWAFLKYHHPAVCSGEINWDYQLFRTIPAVLEAETDLQRELSLLALVSVLETVEPGSAIAPPADENRIETDLSWMDDSVLGDSLSEELEKVYAGRHQGDSYYVTSTPFPTFSEEGYSSMLMPDDGFRLLALYRYWGMIEYFFPYRYATNTDWSDQIRLSLPLFIGAESELEYQLAVKRLIASVGDTHAGLWNEPDALKAYYGELYAPLQLRYLSDNFIVSGYTHSSAIESPVKIGDVILECDGIPVTEIVADLLPLANGSTPWGLMNIMGRYILRGKTDAVSLVIERGGQQYDVSIPRVLQSEFDRSLLPGPAIGSGSFSLTEDSIGYVDGSSLQISDIPVMKETLREARGIVLDMRGYPSEFIVYDVADFILPDSVVFSELAMCDFNNPGTFYWADPLYAGGGDPNPYAGKVAILVSESSISSSEFHTMAWRLAPEAMVFGHTTNGADGNVVSLTLPGGIQTMFTGLGIYNPDRTETQRVGIIPDIEVNPTVEGMQAGTDEVLEAALEWIRTS